ncbi:DUF1572 family protein [uncultured Microscilla sp.]|uniref:DUF1572 family protein n=1 Tax=uncultured Microscilla sp. TaxID=432653 RepID=UPI002633D1B7|nr:DUF1572 family protein [uncultured Microscilla sp.]
MNTEQIINYLTSAQKQFEYYKLLGEKTMAQLSDEELFWQANESSNSVAIIGKHLWGNMRSRWSDFLTSDGEKEWRNRDAEFEADIKNREELMQKWEEGWQTVFEALASITADNFATTIYIRNMGHTITEAVNRQMAHYAYHIGQLVFLGKLLKGKQWQSLSIAKGKSQAYNQEKFAKPKHREHFTQAFLKDKGN